MFTTGNKTVDAIGQMNLQGNVIPHNWYKYIKMENGKTDALGVLILSEIVYWHRPTLEKDEISGAVKSYKKKFKKDMLQKNYEQLASQFGFTKRQVKDALGRLEEKGIITRHFRTVLTDQQLRMNNVLFIELHESALYAITFESVPYDVKTSQVLQQNGTAMTLKRQTNTENTTKTTTKTTTKEKDINVTDVPLQLMTEIVDYLNEHCNTKYKSSSKKTQTLIKARIKEGFTKEDFKTVINKKAAEWLQDNNMVKYLRPETLFGTKFESYLNQQGGNQSEGFKANYEQYDFEQSGQLPF